MAEGFASAAQRRVLVFDGAMGTSIYKCDCDLHRDYLGRENCPEALLLTRPELIRGIHESFLEVGADVVETNTFGANKLVLAEFDFVERTREINRIAAAEARRACDRFSTPERRRFVAGSMGPGTRLVSLGNTTWDEMLDSYAEQARGLLDGGADVFIIETCQDILQTKCAINACLLALRERGMTTDHVPIMASVTIETTGTMLLGTEIAAAAEALRNFPVLSLGLNCATGPVEMAEHIHWLGRRWKGAVSVMPNAGLPALVDGRAEYPLAPRPFAESVLRYVEQDGVNIVGGCCGTTPEHIRMLAEAVGGRAPVRIEKNPPRRGCSSLYTAVEFRQDNSALLVGERTNTNGSRQFKRLLNEEDWDGLVSMAREQVRDGSHVLDVCVDYVGRDGARDMAQVVQRYVRQVQAPLMIDSTQIDVLEAGLKHAGGKCVINSMNLEEGEEKMARICELARTYGAAVIAGTIDEDPEEAMAKTAARKLSIARRIADLAVGRHGMDPGDILFDPLVLPVTTGVEADRRLALETVEGVRLISRELPECGTLIGLSNVSFGLKPAARTVLNSVFLHECMAAGLTGAIAHSSKILPRTRIPDEQWGGALDLIYDRRRPGHDPLLRFIEMFPEGEEGAAAGVKVSMADLPIEERLQRHIIDGEMRNLGETLDEAMTKYEPLAIVNDHLLAGMKVVGDLFGSGQMQLPFVLQSAEVMKAAVARLQPHMPKVGGSTKGTVVLATVQGDVHDIGKNLVDIILTNNGYTVHNLGIKQPVASIIGAWREKKADAIGMSGLLVKSVAVMRENLLELRAQGIGAPVLLGGAALNRHYCETELRSAYEGGDVYYGRDAFEGLRVMDHLMAGRADALRAEIADRLEKRARAEKVIARAGAEREEAPPDEAAPVRASPEPLRRLDDVPSPPFWGDRVVEGLDLNDVYPFINTVALFRGQWQFKKGAKSDEAYERQVREQVEPLFERLKARCRDERSLRPRVVYGWFPCNSDGESVIVYDPKDHEREVERFTFPRQRARQRLCIADYFLPVSSGRRDVIGMHCVTVGEEVGKKARALFEGGEYAEYLYLHGLGVETAEALAELWHKRMRQELGVGGDDSPRVRDLFVQRYRGSRYSFGYPACPDMSDQEKLFRLLRPDRIGCELTDNWQIDPEQSTSAIIVHHPQAKYFAV
ncbi:MAG: methionine synthase [Phycisphaerales bacterium]|nr:methionine synthase [Phycisphaerales bacterium]